MKFEHFDYRVRSGENWDLYVSTYGYAYIQLWGMVGKLKKYFPNEKGYIWVGKKRVDFKKLLYQVVYPSIDLKRMLIFKIGPNYDIRNIFILNHRDFFEFKKKHLKVIKNYKTGKCWLQTREKFLNM